MLLRNEILAIINILLIPCTAFITVVYGFQRTLHRLGLRLFLLSRRNIYTYYITQNIRGSSCVEYIYNHLFSALVAQSDSHKERS